MQRRAVTKPGRRPAAAKGGGGRAAAPASKDVVVGGKGAASGGSRKPGRRPAAAKGGGGRAAAPASKDVVVGGKGAASGGSRKPGRRPAARKSTKALTAKEVREMKRAVPKGKVYVGIDLHKRTLQIAVVDGAGTIFEEAKILNDFDAIRALFLPLPRDRSRCVVESSSMWYAVYRFIEGMGFDIVLSNPTQTALIAKSKNKNDKVDARRLAELLRLNSIPACYVPDDKTVKERETAAHRARLSRARAKYKMFVQSILLQKAVKVGGPTWSHIFVAKLRRLGDWRINQCLDLIADLDELIARIDLRIKDMVAANPAARLLTSVPGFGNFTALAIAAWIGPIERFSSPYALAPYFGLVPSERSSADIVRHGHITKTGSSIVRWILAEAVLTHVGHVDSDITRYYERLCERMPAKKAMVAAMHKLLRIVFWMLKKNLTFANCMAEGGAQFRGCRRKAAVGAAAAEGT